MPEIQMISNRYYILPDGRVAYVNGGVVGMVRYKFNDEHGYRDINLAGCSLWKETDMIEFPDEKDKTLPYVFDLNWDVKYVSGLSYMILHKESIQGMDFDLEDAQLVLDWINDIDSSLWTGYNLSTRDFNRIRRCLWISFKIK
jgi:hypothetical protein